MTTWQLRSTAIHEAAHTCVARRLGGRSFRVSVFDGPGGGGVCTFDAPDGRDWFEKRLAILMAGPVAVSISCDRDPLESQWLWQEARDTLRYEKHPRPNAYAWALEHVRRWYPDEAESVLDGVAVYALRRAVDLIRENWAEIRQLAARLETEKEIVL